jgi:hypothetical protein
MAPFQQVGLTWALISPQGDAFIPKCHYLTLCVYQVGGGGCLGVEVFLCMFDRGGICEHNSPIATPHKTVTHHISKWKNDLSYTALWFYLVHVFPVLWISVSGIGEKEWILTHLHSSQVSHAVLWQKRRYSSDLVKLSLNWQPQEIFNGEHVAILEHTWYLIRHFKIALFLVAVSEDAGIWTQDCLEFAWRVRGAID